MPGKRRKLNKLAQSIKKARTDRFTYTGPPLGEDFDYTNNRNWPQEYKDFIMKLAAKQERRNLPAQSPIYPSVKPTGKWYDWGNVNEDDVTPHESKRLQYYFDRATAPPGSEHYSKVNYWVLYFDEYDMHGGEWTARDWSKWRAHYFAQNPERREAHAEYMRAYHRNRKRKERKVS